MIVLDNLFCLACHRVRVVLQTSLPATSLCAILTFALDSDQPFVGPALLDMEAAKGVAMVAEGDTFQMSSVFKISSPDLQGSLLNNGELEMSFF